nr:MAG TPA: hypothetical protein [Caudoviricetes sp.]
MIFIILSLNIYKSKKILTSSLVRSRKERN